MKLLRWALRNFPVFAKSLLAAHLLRARLFGNSAHESPDSPGEQLQECT
jgi:hypothetical protein